MKALEDEQGTNLVIQGVHKNIHKLDKYCLKIPLRIILKDTTIEIFLLISNSSSNISNIRLSEKYLDQLHQGIYLCRTIIINLDAPRQYQKRRAALKNDL